MNYHDNTFDPDIPLCSFGPGGDFTGHWSELLKDNPAPQTKLGKVLAALAEIVTATAACGVVPEATEAEPQAAAVPNIRIVKTEMRKGVHIKAIHPSDTKAARAAQAGRPAPGQLLLFGLDAGAGGGSADKQDNSVRAHHRPAKKKAAFGRPRQGTLFEVDAARAISA